MVIIIVTIVALHCMFPSSECSVVSGPRSPGDVEEGLAEAGVAADADAGARQRRVLAQRARAQPPAGVRHLEQRHARQPLHLPPHSYNNHSLFALNVRTYIELLGINWCHINTLQITPHAS